MSDVQLETVGNMSETTIPVSMMGKDEQQVASRFARTPKLAQEITYEFTKDKGYLHQYYMLREQMFVNTWGLSNFSGAEDEVDRHSHILVARKGNHVIGGARITVKSPRNRQPLPMEGNDFALEKVVPQLKLENRKYGEFSRLVLLPQFTSSDCMKEMCRNLHRKCLALGVEYLFSIAPILQYRNNRKTAHALDLNFIGYPEILIPERPEYEGIKMHLLCIDLSKEIIKGAVEEDADIFESAI